MFKNKNKGIVLLFCFLLVFQIGYAQLGGTTSFAFLETANNARFAAIGGQNYSVIAQDPSAFLSNPALLSDTSKNYFGLQYGAMPSKVKFLNASFNTKYKRLPIGLAIRKMAYGTLDGYDEGGNPTGSFSAADYAITIGSNYQSGPFKIGANINYLASAIQNYKAKAVSFDIGGLFKHPTRDFTIALVVRNTGFGIQNYSPSSKVYLPFNLGFGLSYKLEHMPLRFSLTSHNWQRWDVTYLDPNKIGQLDASGNQIKENKTFFDSFARHFVIGGEFVFSKAFNFRFGYNHLINRELKLENSVKGAGFTYGFMLKVKGIEFAYSKANYNAAGGTNFVGINMALKRFFEKKIVAGAINQ